MPALQVVSSAPVSGKTTVATAIAQGLARAGQNVRIERIGSGPAAEADAASFADYLFASSGGVPMSSAPSASVNEVLILELDGAATPQPGIPALVAVHGNLTDGDASLATALGAQLLGTIAVSVDPQNVEGVARDLTNAGLRPLALLPEDLMLAAPSVGEITALLKANVLYDGDNDREVVEDIVIAPVFADPARPHFRRFDHKAILAPFNKTDLHLAAIESQAACLVITGGKNPSPYVMDRAQHDSTTVLLTEGDTPATVAALGHAWSGSRFRGENKANAAYALLEGRIDFQGLLKKLES